MATTNYSWNLPTVGGSEDTWGTSLNANWTALDTLLGGTNATEFAILDGATVTTAEFNYLSGVTSAVQTQINSKAASAITVSAGAGLTGGGDLSASRTISHADTSSQGSVVNSGTTFIQSITLDTYGHITALTSAGVPGASDPTTAQVLTAYAGATAREVGSYTTAFYAVSLSLSLNNGASIAVGTEVAGSSLRVATSTTSTNTTYYVSPFETLSAGTNSFPTGNTTTLSGTWRLMTSGSYGRYTNNDPETYVWYPHLWLRIS
jgi:hypothetical protein